MSAAQSEGTDEGHQGLIKPAEILQEHNVALTAEALIAALERREELVRLMAVKQLGEMKVKEAVDSITSILLDNLESVNVRLAAAEALLLMDNRSGVKLLREFLMDAEDMVRLESGRILCDAGVTDGAYGYLSVRNSKTWVMRSSAFSVIAQCPEFAWDIAFLSSGLADENVYVRMQTIEVLARAGNLAAVPFLIDALDDESENVRFAAANQLSLSTGHSFGFKQMAPESERQQAIVRWKAWWVNQGE